LSSTSLLVNIDLLLAVVVATKLKLVRQGAVIKVMEGGAGQLATRGAFKLLLSILSVQMTAL
jgi:hypothetical protein